MRHTIFPTQENFLVDSRAHSTSQQTSIVFPNPCILLIMHRLLRRLCRCKHYTYNVRSNNKWTKMKTSVIMCILTTEIIVNLVL